MGNIGAMLKRFISNKNTVTLLVIIGCTIILYACYNWRVKSAVTTTYTCYAVQTIPARTEITEEMVSTVKILSSQTTSNMKTNCSDVIGKYASYAAEIPANSYFYSEALMDKEQMPDSAFDEIPDNYTIYNLSVSFQSTYGNSVFPGDYIDLFLRTEEPTTGLLLYGKFIQGIKVLGVKDSSGQNVFETTVETRTPSQLLFSVPDDLYLLLKKAEYLGLELVIVPRNNNYTAEDGEVLIASDYLKQLIIDQTAEIPDECILETTGTAECRLADDITDNPEDYQDDDTTPDDGQGENTDEPSTPTEE